jgi:tRNA-modifying protein YgfZ
MMAAMESSGKTTDNFTSALSGSVPLPQLGVLRARGADTLTFLQGQLSNDILQLSAQRSLIAGYHNPQGRAIALLRLIALAGDDVLAVLPRELVAPVAQRLSRFILRSRLRLADDSAHWHIEGIAAAAGRVDLPQSAAAVAADGGLLTVCVSGPPARWLRLSPSAAEVPPLTAASLTHGEWQALAIAAGEPQVYARTSEEFVAQMLNLDALGAIAFQKGCYTGQEVIARAHYRGRVKRRMQRFRSRAAQRLSAGDSGTLTDGRTFKVVEAVALPDGRCEFLAVASLSAAETSVPPGSLAAEQLLLPYDLPE